MACEICGDSGWKTVEADGVEQVARCDCWQAKLVEHSLAAARIPRRYRHCELTNFEQSYDSLREAHRKARAFIDAFPVVDRGLLLRGQHGVGKTHLAVAILKAVVGQRGARGYFYETRELLKLVRDTYSSGGDETEMEVLRPVLDADLLVLDDLGAEKTSEWVQETLGLVVNTRYSEGRPTIFTTNLEDGPDSGDPNSMVFRLGARIRSRLFEMCDWVHMEGIDAREVGGPNPTPGDIARYHERSPLSPENLRGTRRLPDRSRGMARAQLRERGPAELKWTGGKAGS
ncbi:MAG: ATP-binding protein [Vicinamibacterales bacterium]|nr:ATP-binding protein [Vicinamibacterales bacterium]